MYLLLQWQIMGELMYSSVYVTSMADCGELMYSSVFVTSMADYGRTNVQ